jgi:acyl-CoA synthetase (AMP-forming)/AMP-acid ligase II
MGFEVLLELPASLCPDRIALGSLEGGITFDRLWHRTGAGAARLARTGAGHVGFIGLNGPAFTLALFAAARAGRPITPLNYRLADEQLHELIARIDDALIIVDDDMAHRLPAGVSAISTGEFLAATESDEAAPPRPEVEAPAVVLFTSGTTSAPKGVLLRHDHLTSYVLQTVEMAGAAESDCALVSVPPYHVAGVASALSNAYAGRRVVHLPEFSAESWLATVRQELVSSAMVVPTMLARVVAHLDGASADVPSLRAISYGGARLAPAVLERALAAFPATAFTNAYGLTETSSTIAVLGPQDHRDAVASDRPEIRARLGSAGRAVPGIEFLIRGDDGRPCEPEQVGDLYVRGPQVSGEYVGSGSSLDSHGWFATRDRARIDSDGYVFIEGRADDTIIRGGENIAPSEIEAVLLKHPDVADAAVIGLPDEAWGERIVAVVVGHPGALVDPEALREFARGHLRGSKTPETITVWTELPYNPLGKLVRRDVLTRLTSASPQGV